MKKSTKTQTSSLVAAQAALDELANSVEVRTILANLRAAQRACEIEGTWQTTTATREESALGHLQMALEAAGVQF